MEERIIETCVNCEKHCVSFKRIKDPDKCDIYLNVCGDCPFKGEFMILSENEKTLLPIELKNIYSIIELIKKNKFYYVEKTGVKINLFIETMKKSQEITLDSAKQNFFKKFIVLILRLIAPLL